MNSPRCGWCVWLEASGLTMFMGMHTYTSNFARVPREGRSQSCFVIFVTAIACYTHSLNETRASGGTMLNPATFWVEGWRPRSLSTADVVRCRRHIFVHSHSNLTGRGLDLPQTFLPSQATCRCELSCPGNQ